MIPTNSMNPTFMPLNDFSTQTNVILGSSSKWRRKVVTDHFGPLFLVDTIAPDIDEKALRHETAEGLVEMISRAKADAVRAKLTPVQMMMGAVIVTGDQVVRFQGVIREKPIDPAENVSFLESYRNSVVETVTGVCVDSTITGKRAFGYEISRVHYGLIPDDVIAAVVGRGDSAFCCGGLVVEDEDLAKCMTSMEGTMDAVMGLPVALLDDLMKKVA